MKKFFLSLLLILFFTNLTIAQGGPPTPPCSCCTDLEPIDSAPPSQEYTDCINDCLAGNEPCLPIDSLAIFLQLVGISLAYVIINKKDKLRT